MSENNHEPKIYLLPNLMTAGNLFCGFAAIKMMLLGALEQNGNEVLATDYFHKAILFILAACVCDLLDGRLARLGGQDSPFGREFDSLADVVSFGVAPALMVYRIILHDFQNAGWLIASLYLICGALRLARFNCIAAASHGSGASDDFKGFPIPAAAGLISSLTYFMLWLSSKPDIAGKPDLPEWTRWLLAVLLIFLSWLMFSSVRYPSFKGINWRTKRSVPRFLAIVIAGAIIVMNYEWMPFFVFLAYLLYGFLRPFIPRKMQAEIEDEDDDADTNGGPPGPNPGHGI